jgi:hypothetical protein
LYYTGVSVITAGRLAMIGEFSTAKNERQARRS